MKIEDMLTLNKEYVYDKEIVLKLKQNLSNIVQAKNQRTKRARLKKILQCPIEQYIDENLNVDVPRCGFCGRIQKFKEYDIIVNNTDIVLRNVKFKILKNHGAISGFIKYKKTQKLKDSSSLSYFINKYGEHRGNEMFNNKVKNTIQTKQNFIKRYGSDDKYYYYIKRKKNSMKDYYENLSSTERSNIYDTSSLKYFNTKYGVEKGKIKYKEKLRKFSYNKASKESLTNFFNGFIRNIQQLSEFSFKYYVGTENNSEWFIFDESTNKLRFYDFCIPELNLIIEYHGSEHHFNEDYCYKREFNWLGTSSDERKSNDDIKRKLSEKKGFDYYVVFDTDDFSEKIAELTNKVKDLICSKK